MLITLSLPLARVGFRWTIHDRIIGSTVTNDLYGALGDFIRSGAGDDSISGDQIESPDGDDQVFGGAGEHHRWLRRQRHAERRRGR